MKKQDQNIKIVAGNSNLRLADDIANYLKIPLTKCNVRRFADMEVFVEILENVRGEDVFVVQSTSYPANDHLMELLILIDALKRSSARRITAVIPYYGYARQDRRTSGRTPISAKLVANLIPNAGADRVLTIDLHAGQIQGFFDIPLDDLSSNPLFEKSLRNRRMVKSGTALIVSPDAVMLSRLIVSAVLDPTKVPVKLNATSSIIVFAEITAVSPCENLSTESSPMRT